MPLGLKEGPHVQWTLRTLSEPNSHLEKPVTHGPACTPKQVESKSQDPVSGEK